MLGLLAATDEGIQEIRARDEAPRTHLPGQKVWALSRDGSGWWALAGAQMLWRSEDGVSWQQAATVEEFGGNCLAPTSMGLLVGTTQAHLLRLRDDATERVESFELVEGREDWYTPWGGPPDVRSISQGPDGSIYVNVHVGGIVRSTDEGESWDPTIDIDADVHHVLAPAETPGLVLAATARGLATSRDGGDSWSFHTDGLHATYMRAVALLSGTVFVTASEGPRGRQAAVYRRALDATERFSRCEDGLPEWFPSNVDTGCLAAAEGVVGFGTADGSVFVSRDQGQSWERWASGLPAVRWLALA